jgi:hypothetical protein
MRTIRFKETNSVSWVFTVNGISFFSEDLEIEITSAEVSMVKGSKGIEYSFSSLDPVKRILDEKISFRRPWPQNKKEATALAIKYAKEVLDF